LKVISVQRLSREALAALAPAITTLARAEGLEGHARSVEVRINEDSSELSAEAGSSTLKRAPRHD